VTDFGNDHSPEYLPKCFFTHSVSLQ